MMYILYLLGFSLFSNIILVLFLICSIPYPKQSWKIFIAGIILQGFSVIGNILFIEEDGYFAINDILSISTYFVIIAVGIILIRQKRKTWKNNQVLIENDNSQKADHELQNKPQEDLKLNEQTNKYKIQMRIFACLSAILLCICCVTSYLYVSETRKTKDYDELQARFHNIYESNQNLRSKLSNMEDEYEFYHNYAVIVTESGTKYHRYGCYHIENKSFYIYNIENAKSHGYTACKDCFGMV